MTMTTIPMTASADPITGPTGGAPGLDLGTA